MYPARQEEEAQEGEEEQKVSVVARALSWLSLLLTAACRSWLRRHKKEKKSKHKKKHKKHKKHKKKHKSEREDAPAPMKTGYGAYGIIS